MPRRRRAVYDLRQFFWRFWRLTSTKFAVLASAFLFLHIFLISICPKNAQASPPLFYVYDFGVKITPFLPTPCCIGHSIRPIQSSNSLFSKVIPLRQVWYTRERNLFQNPSNLGQCLIVNLTRTVASIKPLHENCSFRHVAHWLAQRIFQHCRIIALVFFIFAYFFHFYLSVLQKSKSWLSERRRACSVCKGKVQDVAGVDGIYST